MRDKEPVTQAAMRGEKGGIEDKEGIEGLNTKRNELLAMQGDGYSRSGGD